MCDERPDHLSGSDALRAIRGLAADSRRIVLIEHAKQRGKLRKISPLQVERCLLKGTITEGPFLNQHQNWQVTMYRHAAGEEVNCVVAIEWQRQLLVITVY